jgi:hypothetical protein
MDIRMTRIKKTHPIYPDIDAILRMKSPLRRAFLVLEGKPVILLMACMRLIYGYNGLEKMVFRQAFMLS